MKKYVAYISLACLIVIVAVACSGSPKDYFADSRDGTVYNYTNTEGKVWMTCNLKFINKSIYCNGAWVFSYDKDEYSDAMIRLKKNKSGVLYNQETAQKAIPEGWRIPSSEDWRALISAASENGATIQSNLNISLDGRARSFDKFCIYSGITFWTSDSLVKSDGTIKGISVVIDYKETGKLTASFVEENPDFAFYVRCIKNDELAVKNTHR